MQGLTIYWSANPDKVMETGSEQGVPFWNVNLPRDQWTNTCPDYLLGIDHWDQAQLTVRDEDYTPMSWDEVKDLVGESSLLQ